MNDDQPPNPDEDVEAIWERADGPWLPSFAHEDAWHYTTAEGLLGILESNRIWASAPQVLNDESEVLYGVDITREALSSLDDEGALPKPYSDYLHRVIDDSWIESMQSSIFVASASENGDLLNQWRNYANADGFAVGFRTGKGGWGSRSVLAVQGRPSPDGVPTLFTPVISGWYRVNYDRDQQIRQARNTLLFSAVRPSIASPEWPNDETEWSESANHTRLYLSVIPLVMKHPAFADERELRYIGGATNNELRFRGAAGRVVPYTPVGLLDRTKPYDQADEKLPIQEVVCGPGCRPGTVDVVRRALKSFGYSDVAVAKSGIPFIG